VSLARNLIFSEVCSSRWHLNSHTWPSFVLQYRTRT